MSGAHAMRLQQGAAAVLTLNQAADLLPIARDRARDWLVREGLVRDLDGTEVVVWSEVLTALQSQATQKLTVARPGTQRFRQTEF